MNDQRPWHRLFGLSWTDFFRGLPVTVEMEKDLSLKKQMLDILIIQKESATLDCELPDGFEELTHYNLITFKSQQEKLSAWSLCELVGHYVNLRKQVSPTMDEGDLLNADDFKLFAVSVRHPQQLASSNVLLKPVKQGVYDIQYFGGLIRLVVVNQLPTANHNAMLNVFSSQAELWSYGVEHYRIKSLETTSLLYDVLIKFRKEYPDMPDALEEFTKQTIARLLKELPVEKRLEGLSPEDRIKGLSPDDRIKGLSPEDRIKGLSPEDREALLRLLMTNDDSSKQ